MSVASVAIMWGACVALLAAAAVVHGAPTAGEEQGDSQPFDLLMPNVQPKVNDTYFCHPMTVQEDELYLTDFASHADMNVAHHILIYGCEEPGYQYDMADEANVHWNCGEMASKGALPDDAPKADVCASGSKIIYAWAMDAPDLHLPKDVGFKVGRDTSIKTLVLQVHYKDVRSFLPPNNNIDKSGVTITATTEPQPKTAGVYLLASGAGDIPPHSTTYMDIACSYDTDITLHPFAFRVHAHSWGRVVSGYRVRDDEWTELGRQDPRNPQMFYNVTDPSIDIEQGDILAARCTFHSDENRTISIGATQNDEMCNFYVMYYVDGTEELNIDESYCVKPGPPMWNWSNFQTLSLDNMPDSVSVNPFTNEEFEQTEQALDNLSELVDDIDDDLRERVLTLLESLETEPEQYEGLDEPLGLQEEEYYEPEGYYPPEVMEEEAAEAAELERRILEEYAYRNQIEEQRRAAEMGYDDPRYYQQWQDEY